MVNYKKKLGVLNFGSVYLHFHSGEPSEAINEPEVIERGCAHVKRCPGQRHRAPPRGRTPH